MSVSRDDFSIAFRSALLQRGGAQKFSVLSLIFLALIIFFLDVYGVKFTKPVRSFLNDVVYRVTFLASTPTRFLPQAGKDISSFFNVREENEKLKLDYPKIKKDIILKSPELLISKQSEFSKTGGIHASSLIDLNGKVIVTREDVGRHNALDKLIGFAQKNKLVDNHSQFIACSGRLNFELVQKGLMSNIAVMAGVGAPTSLAIDLAKRFNMTLIGFVKKTSFNIYTNKNRIIL